ncbi:MAG: hypothetical protein ACE361_04385 [Aureliella sp.]
MQTEAVIDKLILAAEERGYSRIPSGNEGVPSDSLLGIFQLFRPDGISDLEIFAEQPGGPVFEERLSAVFAAVGDGGRGDGLKDAYFVVRNPPAIDESAAKPIAESFVHSSIRLSSLIGSTFEADPDVRILEGKPPKHPRAREEQAPLLGLLQRDLPSSIAEILNANSLAAQLQEALYFVACDHWLRDYLRWPLASAESTLALSQDGRSALDAALDAYFTLWVHGIKFRIFSNRQVDFYLPRRSDGTLIDAGQFANKRSN